MKRETYTEPEMEVICISEKSEIITNSNLWPDESEGDFD